MITTSKNILFGRTYNLSTWFWVGPGASSQQEVPGTPPQGGDQEASSPDAQTTSTGSFQRKGAATPNTHTHTMLMLLQVGV